MGEARPIFAVVPVKRWVDAKQRLRRAFSPAFCRALAAAMTEDVLAALAGVPALAGLVVVTNDPEVCDLARRYGATIQAEGAADGHTGAVTAAAHRLAARGRGMLSLPGDVPAVTTAELATLLRGHPEGRAVSIVPARDRRGSNAIVATPADAMPVAYGNDSFAPHLATARRLGLAPVVRELPGIGLDVDAADDLFAFAALNLPTRTHGVLAASPEFAAANARRRTVAVAPG